MTESLARVRRESVDAVLALSIFITALVAVPSELIVGALGSAGTPAEIIGLFLFAAWAVATIGASPARQVRQPMRLMLWLFAVTVVLSYIAANLRSMLSDESRSADSGLLLVLSWLGVALLAMDRIPSLARLDILLRRLVLAGGALATLGLLQFITKEPFTNYIEIPGLQANQSLVALYGRNGLVRAVGTAIHPIEFGAVLTMVLPLALHYALVDGDRSLVRRWYPVAAIAFAVPISISRSALVSTIAVLCFLIPTWTKLVRRRAIAAIVGISGSVYLIVPGLLGTLSTLFTGISGDSSAQSRTSSFSLAFEFVARTPIFGRGFLTFLPAYRILDDQYLSLLIETGIFGLAAFLGLLASGVWQGLRIRRMSSTSADASLAVALAASVASALVSFALFDAFSFPMAASTLFLILGCTGALHRLVRAPAPHPRPALSPPAKGDVNLDRHLPTDIRTA